MIEPPSSIGQLEPDEDPVWVPPEANSGPTIHERTAEIIADRRANLPGWEPWLAKHFPTVCVHPFGARHRRLWQWVEALRPGVRPLAFVAVWPRGGAKSSTVELACARLEATGQRRFVAYVSETQDQANRHVRAIASLLESMGVQRSVNTYGSSRGWRIDLLRTESGFSVIAFGLNSGTRGVKLDALRPDMIVLDDVDALLDTPDIRLKKRETITSSVLPAGAADCAVLFVQNRIGPDTLMSQQADGRADWLLLREPVSEEPALIGFQAESIPTEHGIRQWRITAGEPTWAGQSVERCQDDLNLVGMAAFRREYQHDVAQAGGYVFDPERMQLIEPWDVPKGLRICEAWDLAGTEGGGDFTAVAQLGMRGSYPTVEAYILDFEAGQWASDRVRMRLKQRAGLLPPGAFLRLPRDPGQAGIWQENQFRQDLYEQTPRIRPVTGSKATRARGLAECMNLGNVFLVRSGWMETEIQGMRMLDWLKRVLRQFREDEKHEIDDPVDALADAFNELAQYPDASPEEKRRNLVEDQSWLPHALRSRQGGPPGDGLGEEGEDYGPLRGQYPEWAYE